jgi:chorismate dehydratase
MKPKLLGIPTQLITKPLTQALRTTAVFQLVEDARPNIAKRLQEQEFSAALLSPLDYAKESSDYCIVPNVAVVSPEGNGSIVVRFREGIKNVKTLAVDPSYASEIILTNIILAEAFELEPTIVPMIAQPERMLHKADAALLVGDLALNAPGDSRNSIDIVEEWNEMTGLPYVHALWCGRENGLTKEEMHHLQSAMEKGVAGIEDIARECAFENRDALQRYLESFSYTLDDRAREGLAEFMKYLYYHGILPDVAEVKFFKQEEGRAGDLLADISAN